MKLQPYMRDGKWWVDCKHGQRTGPYRDEATARVAVEILREMHGPARP